MKQHQATHYLHTSNVLGEGPIWHPIENAYYWVDIENCQVCRFYLESEKIEVKTLGTSVGALAFRESGGLLLATGKGLGFWSFDDPTLRIIANPVNNQPGVRLNDGKVDSLGRFWVGSLDQGGNAALYRLDPDHTCTTILINLKIANGLAWSLDQETFYFTDSGDHAIYTYTFNIQKGLITKRKTFAQLPADNSKGTPDGLTIDSEGCIWSAIWGGGKITRYSPTGNPILEINLPVSRVTSCTFGGKDMKDLFITTASIGLTEEEIKLQPLAGDIFTYHTEVEGIRTPFFAG
ncbi:MAG: SMP-30/gluconolactonase/LRE family protein [Anaerolineaceae bacterium]|nr:SMP-30/gluconolactonase/LRE family protein [Anaerolineaceae bacterium]